jgi:ribonuclease J
MDSSGAEVTGTVPVGNILVDGLGVGDVGNVVLRDRQHLAEDGIVIISFALDGRSGSLAAGPEITSRGFVYLKEADALMNEADLVVQEAIWKCIDGRVTDRSKIKAAVKNSLGEFFWKKTMRRPVILPMILEIED